MRKFFFLPYYHTGGAEKAHLFVVGSLEEKPVIFFTDRSRDSKYKKKFKSLGHCINFFGIQNKILLLESLFIFVLAIYINNQRNPTVFGSNSRFFYKLIKKLKKSVTVIDLIHWIDGTVGILALKNTQRVNKRVVINPLVKNLLEQDYKKYKINSNLLDRITIIENCIFVRDTFFKKKNDSFNVLFVGRNSSEKRPELVFQIWNKLKNKKVKIEIIGRGMSLLSEDPDYQNIVIDNIENELKLMEKYDSAHAIFLVSVFEGFPYVFMEAMSRGVVPISTKVGGIPYHLNNKNSSLCDFKEDGEIVDCIVSKIIELSKNNLLYAELSNNAFNYAKDNFSCNEQINKYKKLFYD